VGSCRLIASGESSSDEHTCGGDLTCSHFADVAVGSPWPTERVRASANISLTISFELARCHSSGGFNTTVRRQEGVRDGRTLSWASRGRSWRSVRRAEDDLRDLRSKAGRLQGEGIFSARRGLMGEQFGNVCLLPSLSDQSSFVGNVLQRGP
jgi:hypothetical protein